MVERYAELLATTGVVRGLIGPREAPRLWDRHLLNSVVLAERLPLGATVCDVGSGAGLPGLVVAIARADLMVTLVEPLLRRTTFLEEVVLELGLSNVEVVRGRAEVLHGVREFDVVTSRAVAPLPQLLAWSMPLVGAHGVLLALKGASAADELAAAEMDLQRWGCAAPEVVELGVGVVSSPAHAVRVAWADPTAVRWPPTDGARGRSSTRPQHNSRKQRRSHG